MAILEAITRLIRLRNCIIAFFGVIIGALLAYNGVNIFDKNVIIASLGAAFITGAGNTINDYFDADIDKINKPKRPIPSGEISKNSALFLSIIMFLLGINFARYASDICFGIAIINSIILIMYAKYSKRMLIASNIFISYLVASIFLYGAVSVLDSAQEIFKANIVLILVICAFFMTLSREIIKDIEDIDGDKRLGSISLPIAFGENKSKDVAIIFAAAAIMTSLIPIFMRQESFNTYIYAIFIVIADIIFILSFTREPSKGQKLMAVGMIVSLIAFFAGKIF